MAAFHAICLLLAAQGGDIFAYGLFEQATGPSDCTLVSGNGGLTVGVNPFGRISACRWPSPSYFNQVTYQTASGNLPLKGVAATDGLMWGLRHQGTTRWLNGRESMATGQYLSNNTPLLVTEMELPGLPGRVTQETFIHWERDVLVSRLRLPADAGEVEAYWYANLTPCSRYVPEVPLADWKWEGLNDFGAFVSADRSVIYHFRPLQPSSADWQDIRLWISAADRDLPAPLMREGVWIGYGASAPFLSVTCASDEGEGSAFDQADRGTLGGRRASSGQCASAARVPEDTGAPVATATVYMAFGKTRHEVDSLLTWSRKMGYETLLNDTQAYWNTRLDEPELTDAVPLSLQEQLKNCLLTLAVATDRETGAIVRAPVSQPPLALDVPRHSVWAGVALDRAGRHEDAGKHLDFLLGCVRRRDRPGMPAGSLPAAVYADGVDGAPHVILDGEAPGWLLWALWQHDAYLESEKQTVYFEDRWEAIDTLATFLMNRSEVRLGAPLYSFDPRLLREGTSTNFVVAAYIGLRSADVMARVLGHDRPEWRARQEELEDTLRAAAFDSDSQWKLERPLVLWPADIIDAGDPRWEPVTEHVLAELAEVPPVEALEDLCALALLWQDQPERLARLAPHLSPAITRARRTRPVDTLDASRAVIAVTTVYGGRAGA